MKKNKQFLLFSVALIVILVTMGVLFISRQNKKSIFDSSIILPTIKPTIYVSPTPYPDLGKKCTDGNQCLTGLCVDWKCWKNNDIPIGDYNAVPILIDGKVYSVTQSVTGKLYINGELSDWYDIKSFVNKIKEENCNVKKGTWRGSYFGGYCLPATDPKQEKDCKNKGGFWWPYGPSGEKHSKPCQFSASDSGKECTDGNQCSTGICSYSSRRDFSKRNFKGGIPYIGGCSEYEYKYVSDY